MLREPGRTERRLAALGLVLLAALALQPLLALAPEAAESQGITVRVQPDGKLRVGADKVKVPDLAKRLRKELESRPEPKPPVLLDVQPKEKDSVFLAEILDACAKAGAAEVGLLLPTKGPAEQNRAMAGARELKMLLKPDGHVFVEGDWIPKEHLSPRLKELQRAAPYGKVSLEIASVDASLWAWYGDLERILQHLLAVGVAKVRLTWLAGRESAPAPDPRDKSHAVFLVWADGAQPAEPREAADFVDLQKAPWNPKAEWDECPAARVSSPISIVWNWKAGDRLFVRLTEFRSQPRGEKVEEGTGITDSTLTVRETGEEGAILEWNPGVTTLLGLETPESAAVIEKIRKLMQESSGLAIQYRTDPQGRYAGLLDFEQATQKFGALATKLLQLMPKEGLEPKAFDAMRSMMSQIKQNPEMLEALWTEDIQMLHFPYGLEFENQEPLRFEVQVPFSPAGTSIPGDLSIQLTRYSEARDCAELVVTVQPDSEALDAVARELLAKMAADLGQPTPNPAHLWARLVREDQRIHRLRPSTGRPLSIQTNHLVRMLGKKSIRERVYVFLETPFE